MQVVPREQIVHVEYEDLVADPAPMAMSIYERLGYSTDAALKARMTKWRHRAQGHHVRAAQALSGVTVG